VSATGHPARPAPGALAGLRVLDLATLYAAPFISTLLADQGADVLKVEPPGGDPYRDYPTRMWSLLARGKRSIELDLRSDEGCDEVRRLVADIDVVVVNMPEKLLDRQGLDYATLTSIRPELIYVHVSGYGLGGPASDQPGNGTLAEAYGGLTHMTGPADGAPVLASVPLADAVTGYVGAFGVLAACYHRIVNGGGGQVIDVNPLDSVLQVIGPVLSDLRDGESAPGRLGNRLKGSIVRNVFATSDGEWVSISLSTPRHVGDTAALVGHTDTDDDGNPSGDLEGSIRAWAAHRTRDEVLATFLAGRLPAAPVNSAVDIAADAHIRARNGVIWVDTEQGPVLNPAPAPRLLGSPAPAPRSTPPLGDH
jgi:formyl-CoA transferase